MKKLALFASALVLFAACGEKPDPSPSPEPEVEASLEVSTSDISVKAADTSASINVTANCAWKAASDNSAFTLSPSSGNGNGTITVSFPANEQTSEVKAGISISSDGVTPALSVKVNIVQAAAEAKPDPEPEKPSDQPDTTYLARWWLDESQVEVLKVHFHEEAKIDGAPNPEACLPGNGGYYIEPNVSGKGRIEFYNGIDKTEINPKGRVKRVIGKYGGVVSYGTWKGDYYLLTAETDAALAAGTKVYTFFALRPNVENVPKYWMVEIMDGDTWVPYLETKKVTVEGEGEVEYNLELIYDNDAAEIKCINSIVDSNYALKNSTKNVVIRILAVSGAYAYGPGLPSVIGDSPIKTKNPVTILVGNRESGGEPVLHHTMICTVK